MCDLGKITESFCSSGSASIKHRGKNGFVKIKKRPSNAQYITHLINIGLLFIDLRYL